MTISDFPERTAGRPIWLVTLADLALLLVGFFVLMQANRQLDGKALAAGLRQGFGVAAPAPADPAPTDPMPVAAAAMLNFAPGSSALPTGPAGLVAWAREAVRDPRVALKVTGSVDGSPADVDAATASGAVLAADRARAVAAALAVVAPGRMTIVNAAPSPDGHSSTGQRQVIVTLAFAGDIKDPTR